MIGFNATIVLPQNFQVTWQSSCVLWLRADKGITIATGVSTWVDQTTNAYSYTQGTGSAQPTTATVNGQSSLRFTRSASQYLNNSGWTLAEPMDVFVVAQLASTPSAFDGWISEVIEFSAILGSSAAEQVTKYLGARYGITVV